MRISDWSSDVCSSDLRGSRDRASASYITGLQLFTGFETMFAAQFDLFGTPILPGFHYGETIVTADEERALIASIDSAGFSPFRFQGWFGKRLPASFGWRHDFDTARFDTPEPNPAWLLPLLIKAANFSGLSADDLVHVLLTSYD